MYRRRFTNRRRQRQLFNWRSRSIRNLKKVKLDMEKILLYWKTLGFCDHYVISHSPIAKGIVIDGPETSRHRGILLDYKVGLSGNPFDDVVPTLQWTFAINFSKGQFVQELLNGCRWQDWQRILWKERLDENENWDKIENWTKLKSEKIENWIKLKIENWKKLKIG